MRSARLPKGKAKEKRFDRSKQRQGIWKQITEEMTGRSERHCQSKYRFRWRAVDNKVSISTPNIPPATEQALFMSRFM